MTVAAAPVVFDIVVRISVVLDQCAAIFVAGRLNSVWVNGGHGGEESITFMNDDRLVLVIGSQCELRVGPGFDVSVASNHW